MLGRNGGAKLALALSHIVPNDQAFEGGAWLGGRKGQTWEASTFVCCGPYSHYSGLDFSK